MKKNLKKVVLVLALLLPGVIKAQEFNVTAKADFVSDYICMGHRTKRFFQWSGKMGERL